MKPQANVKLKSEQSPDAVPSHGGPAVLTVWELTVEGVRVGYEIVRHKWCADRQKYASIEHAPRNLFDMFKALCERLEEPHRYRVGDRTMRAVFEPNGITNLSNLQEVLDAVEKALGPSPVEHVEGLAARLDHAADDYSKMLEKPSFRPSRDMLEDCRNLLRQASAAIGNPAPVSRAMEDL